jgi:hypothetical protein
VGKTVIACANGAISQPDALEKGVRSVVVAGFSRVELWGRDIEKCPAYHSCKERKEPFTRNAHHSLYAGLEIGAIV